MCRSRAIFYVCGHDKIIENECDYAKSLEIPFFIKMKCPNYQQEIGQPAVSFCGLGKFYCSQSPDAPLFDHAIKTVMDAQATGRQAQDDLLKMTKACDYLTSQCSSSIEAPENQKYVHYAMQKRQDLATKMEQSLQAIKDAQDILRRGAEFYQHRTQSNDGSRRTVLPMPNIPVPNTCQSLNPHSSSAEENVTMSFLPLDHFDWTAQPPTFPPALGSQKQSLWQTPSMPYSSMTPSLQHHAASLNIPPAIQALMWSQRAETSRRILTDAQNREEYQERQPRTFSMQSPGQLPKRRARLDKYKAQGGSEERSGSVRRSARVKNKIINYAESASSASSPERSSDKTDPQKDSPYKPEGSHFPAMTRCHPNRQILRVIPSSSLSEKISDFKRRNQTPSQATSMHLPAPRLPQTMLPTVIPQPETTISPYTRGNAINPIFQVSPSRYLSATSLPTEGSRLETNASDRVVQVRSTPALPIGSIQRPNGFIDQSATEAQSWQTPLSTHFDNSQGILDSTLSKMQKEQNGQERTAIGKLHAGNILHPRIASSLQENDDDVFEMKESQESFTRRIVSTISEIHSKENSHSPGRSGSGYCHMRKSFSSTPYLPSPLARMLPDSISTEPIKRTLPASSPIPRPNKRPRLSVSGEQRNSTQQNIFTAYASRSFTMSSPPKLSFWNTKARAVAGDEPHTPPAPGPVFAPNASMYGSSVPSQAHINQDNMGTNTQSLLEDLSTTSMPVNTRPQNNAMLQIPAIYAFASGNQQEESIDTEAGEGMKAGQLPPREAMATIDDYLKHIDMIHTVQHTEPARRNPMALTSPSMVEEVADEGTDLPILPDRPTGRRNFGDPDLPSAAYYSSDIDWTEFNDIITGGV